MGVSGEKRAAGSAPQPGQPHARVPWTERHPGLVWCGLLGVVAGLAAVTWNALRRA